MCVKTLSENRELRQQVTALKAQIDELTSAPPDLPDLNSYIRWVREQTGEIPLHEVSIDIVREELQALGLEPMFTQDPDPVAFHTDLDHLMLMVPYLTFSADYYTNQYKIDCDDYSMWGASFSRIIFLCNGTWQAWGNTSYGYHAFNIARVDENQYKLWEPNAGFPGAGEPFDLEQKGYIPNKWR